MQLSNIVYLHSHDTGRYVQPYGFAVPTPHIQRLAEEGVLFRQAFCAAPTCSPSRAALLTGQAPHNSGMLGLAHRGWALNDYRQHLVSTLRRAGFSTTLIGMQHEASDPQLLGYEHIIDLPNAHAPTVAPAAVDFLRGLPRQPFFLSVGFEETHRPFPPPDLPGDSSYCLPPLVLPDTPETRHDMAAFKASARLLDAGVGAVLAALDATGLQENTLVICTTDHGIALPKMKCNLTDCGIGVMLIMRGPADFRGGQICDAMVSQIDIFPTLCDLLALARPAWLQGRSLLPLLRHEVTAVNEEIFAEVTYHAAYEPQRAIRTSRWKYIRRFDDRLHPVLPNCDDGPSKALLVQHGWRDQVVAPEQLYDLLFDPGEGTNLANDGAFAEVRDDLRERIAHWMQRTADPLLAGPVPAPPGAAINNPDGLSAEEPTLRIN